MLWGWLRSYTPDFNRQKGELLAIEEVGNLLRGKLGDNHTMSDLTDSSSVPVSLKTQGSYISQYPPPLLVGSITSQQTLLLARQDYRSSA